MTSFAYIFPCRFTLFRLLPFNLSAEYLPYVMLRYTITSLLLLRLLQRDDNKKKTTNKQTNKQKKQILIPALTTFTTPGT